MADLAAIVARDADKSPDGVATLRDIAREIAKAAYQTRARLAALDPEPVQS